ncbi:MAG TPA: ABC transporter ATP-binding protein [Pseudolabrys sp.]|jgi:branched-chain amino acid transport system ATP-binding protein
MPDTPILELKGVSKRYSGLEALSDVSFLVPDGAITALIGPNGAGKSTLFNLISGLDQPTSGQILFSGHEITRLRPHRRSVLGIGRVFQTPRLFDHLTVLENVMVGLHGRTRSGVLQSGLRLPSTRAEEARIRTEAMERLAFVGLADDAGRAAGTLAFGGQRLLEVARALAGAPKLLLLDEPTAGLTPAETDRFSDKLRIILAQGVAILIVEHDLRFISSISDKTVVLAHGRTIYDGDPAGIRRDARVIESYIGTRRERQNA